MTPDTMLSQAPKQGWWADHEYTRRSVRNLEEFCGWDYLDEIREKVERRFGFEKAALPVYLMQGGFRIGELVASSDGKRFGGLRKENVVISEKRGIVMVRGALRLKGYEKVKAYYETRSAEELKELTPTMRRLFIQDEKSGLFIRKRFETKPKTEARTFAFPMSEPWVKHFVQYYDECKEDVLFPFTASWAYQMITEVEPDVWNHWFRSMRSSQLVAEYDFDDNQLMRWFEWKDRETAARYARRGIGDMVTWFPSHVDRLRKPLRLTPAS